MERIHVVSSTAKNPSIIRRSLRRTIFFIIAILAIGSTFEPYNQAQLAVVLIYFIGVLSVTILTGISGQISLGQGALMAVGGYSTALLMTNYSVSLWIAVPASIVGAGIAGALLGIAAARLSGPYLAGTTLVIALAIPTIANRFMSVFKGDEGLPVDVGYPPSWFTNLFGEPSYEEWQLYVALPFAAIALFFASNLLLSRTGRMWKSIRDHETAAALAGVNYSRQKIYVFIIASIFAGLAGALYGLRGLVGPSVYPVALSLTLLTAAVLGGIGNIRGAFYGGLSLGLLEVYASAILGTQWKAVTVFIVLVLVLLFKPNGLFGEAVQTTRA